MAFLGQTFIASDLSQGDSSFLSIPAGDYQVTVSDASLADTKSGTGQYIKLKMTITGPTHQGRVLFSNLNIRNQSSKAEEIGLQQLGELMRAAGLQKVEDTDELVGASIVIKVSKTQDSEYGDEEGFKNEVKAFKSASGSNAPMPKAKSEPEKNKGSKSDSAPPWAK